MSYFTNHSYGANSAQTLDLIRPTKPLQQWADVAVTGSGKPQSERPETLSAEHLYFETEAGTYRYKQTTQGKEAERLANFTARIERQEFFDDGVERRQRFVIGGRRGGLALPKATLSDSELMAMNWPLTCWGPECIVYPGKKSHLLAAVQTISGTPETVTIYGHTGWRRINGSWAYIHADGAIGQKDVKTCPPAELASFALPEPPRDDALARAVRTSLSIQAVARRRVALPLLMGAYRAPLDEFMPVDFSILLTGLTGQGKTQLAALIQSHFGPSFTAVNLPGSWTSTANALERLAFAAKDAVLVVDDFNPRGEANDMNRMHSEADRLLRAQANRQGRSRLGRDGALRTTFYPRGLILSTAEEVPRGHSLRARLLITELEPDTVDWKALTRLQAEAKRGELATAMAGYLGWLAPQADTLPGLLEKRRAELRAECGAWSHSHKRAPDMAASLLAGWECFTRFALETGAVDEPHRKALDAEARQALQDLAKTQAEHQQEADPVSRFFTWLDAALSCGGAHVCSRDTGGPIHDGPFAWPDTGQPTGVFIGWAEGEELFLEPKAAFSVIARHAREEGCTLDGSEHRLWGALRQRGRLVTHDNGHNTVKKTCAGSRRRVLHLRLPSQNRGNRGTEA